MLDEESTRARFDALLQLVAEVRAAGQTPHQLWLDEITRAASAHPEWLAPPVPLPPPPVPQSAPTFVEMPRAAAPINPGVRKKVELGEDMEKIVKMVLGIWTGSVCVFQSSGRLFEVQIEATPPSMKFLINPPNSPRLLQVGAVRARALASRECMFVTQKLTKDGSTAEAPCLPPEWLGGAIVTRPHFDQVPAINALVCAPTLRPDGALIWEKGYDASSGIYLASDFKVSVPEKPTQADAKAAADRLLDLISDFSFVNPAGKSVWLAGVLSVAARHAFSGPVPIIIIDASKRGSGKSLLADAASVLTRGIKASRMFYTNDDVEMDKRITSLALAGEQVVLIDNVVGKLASPPLDAAVTADSYTGRMLGKTEMPSMSIKIVWFVTGNGLIIGADTARRAIVARLEPDTDRPEEREGPRPGQRWKYPHLLDYILEHRAELLGCALTVVRAYLAAGKPNQGLKPMGSFEAWGSVIRSAIVWAGAPDPCETVKEARDADAEDYALRRMVQCWPVANEVETTAAALIKLAEMPAPDSVQEIWRNALLDWLPAKGGAQLPTARDLGYALRAIKGSVVENYRIEAGEPTKTGIPWRRISLTPSIKQDDGDKKPLHLHAIS